jgi:hypothetical protein
VAIDLTLCSQHGEVTAVGWRQALVSRAEIRGDRRGVRAPVLSGFCRRSERGPRRRGLARHAPCSSTPGAPSRAWRSHAAPGRADVRRVAPHQLGHHAGVDSAPRSRVSAGRQRRALHSTGRTTRLASGLTFCTGGKRALKLATLARASGRPLRRPLDEHAGTIITFEPVSGPSVSYRPELTAGAYSALRPYPN